MITTFGNFAKGNLSEFGDPSCGGGLTSVVPNTVIRPSGDFLGRIRSNGNSHCYGQTNFVRVHLLGFPSTAPKPATTPGATIWWAWSIRKTQIAQPQASVVLQEWHQPNGQATCPKLQSIPAPFNFQLRWTGGKPYWNFIVRGSTDCTNGGFISYAWGKASTFSDPGGNRVYRDWAGMDAEVIPGQLYHFLGGWRFAQDGSGWFEGWAAKHGQPMVNVAPRTNCPTTYPFANYPMISQYYSTTAGDVEFEHMFGAMSENVDEIRGWQEGRVNYDIWGGPPPPPPPPPPPVEEVISTSSIHDGDAIPFGSSDWTVTATPISAGAKFFVDNAELETVKGPGTSFTHRLDTTKISAGAHTCGYWIIDANGNALFKSPSFHVTVVTAPPPPPAPDDLLLPGATDAWNTKQVLQAEINRLRDTGMAWPQIERSLGSVKAVPTGQTTLSWKAWQIVKDAKNPSA